MPFGILTAYHLVSVGVAGTFQSCFALWLVTETNYNNFFQTHNTLNSAAFCALETFNYAGPEYSTGVCMLALAVQRFILVRMPFKAKAILTTKFYKIVTIVLLTFAGVMTVGTVVFSMLKKILDNECTPYYYSSTRVQGIVESTIFLFIPAFICVVLYSQVGVALWHSVSMQARNRQLTILFIISCVTWILLWVPSKVFYILYDSWEFDLKSYEILTKRSHGYFIIQGFYHCVYLAFSALNPIIFILCCTPTQQPLKSFAQRLRGVFRCFSLCEQKREIPNNAGKTSETPANNIR